MITRRRSATSLDEALGLLELPAAPSPLNRLKLAWPQICGPLLARHSEPSTLVDGRLTITVGGRDWREALYQERRALQVRIRSVAPSVHEIRLTTRDAGPPTPRPQARPTAIVEPDPRTLDVVDPALRAALDGLLAARQRAAR